jgi:hypothetical protein
MATERELALLKAQKPGLRILADGALNAEAPVELLADPLTPVSAFFVRNNGLLPEGLPADPDGWSLRVEGLVDRPATFTLAELKARFPVVTQVAVIECAGNGRAGYAPLTDGLPWSGGAVACAQWTGVRMVDVLAACGVAAGAVYTGHLSPDRKIDGSGPALSRGLPIAKALAPETLLAFAMNGQPLPLLHGGPLRVVAPGYPGSAWHDGEKMRGLDYRLPRVPDAGADPALYDVITDMPVKSLIVSPAEGARLAAGERVMVSGQAWTGHGEVIRVEVSADGGRSWSEATLGDAGGPFGWRRFTLAVTLDGGEHVLIARAHDDRGQVQPLVSPAWNPKGYCNNAAPRVRITIGG